MTDEPNPTVREHSDEWCEALDRERLAQIADLEGENLRLRCIRLSADKAEVHIAEQDAEITRLREVIAQLREDWRPKAQQEAAAMTAAREVARLRVEMKEAGLDGAARAVVRLSSALDNLVEALDRG
jgi:hypothetical protein